MTDILRQKNLGVPQPEPYAAQPLADSGAAARAPHTAPEADAYVRFLASPALNARLPGRLDAGKWAVRWRYIADPPAPTVAVLRAGDRVLVHAGGAWVLLNRDGVRIARGASGRGALFIDSGSATFYALTPASALEARQLSDGDLRFQNALPYSESFAWPLIVADAVRLVAMANQLPMMSHQLRRPDTSVVQLIELGSPLVVDEFKLLQSLTRFEALQIRDPELRFAAAGDLIAAAGRNLLLFLSTNLELKAAYIAEFQPVLMSMDEAGWVYPIVQTADGRALWVVTPEGKRVLRIALPGDAGNLVQPPVVGYDHRIYLLTKEAVTVYSPTGELLWRTPVPGGIVGGGITLNGMLLVTAGAAISALDPAGKLERLYRLDGESITTPPVYTAHREILVGTTRGVVALAPSS
ncbi:hypothetical protein L6Q96_17305 [Candidatus Binatia bacterium]|nr:hypothetical protein [Candidatus Binatia bacterium]